MSVEKPSLSEVTLSCSEVEPLLPMVADGALEHAKDPALFAHLAECEHCQETLAQHDLISLALNKGDLAPVSQCFEHIRIPLPMSLAAAALVMCAVGAIYWMHASAETEVTAVAV